MNKVAIALALVLAVAAAVACGFGDRGLEARVDQLEAELDAAQSTLSEGDFESRLRRLEDTLYGSGGGGVGARSTLDRLYEVERKVRLLEDMHQVP